MQRHSFMARLSVRNEDGSVSVLRLICLVVLALCMLSYGITLFARDDDKALAQSNSISERESEVSAAVKDTDDDPDAGTVRAIAFRELDEADEYYRQCGTVNEGFVGCDWKFSPSVSKYYEGKSVAADDGFAITLSAKPGNPDRGRCALLEVTSGGDHTSLDEHGRVSECFPREKPQVASNSTAQSASEINNNG